jgi:rhomboid family GlyGly-CTERM serine protease
MRALPWRSLGLAITAIAVFAAPGASSWLSADRAAIGAGQVWRLWTAHLVHHSFSHLVWNVSALVALGFLFERDLDRVLWKLLAISCALVSAGSLVLQPALDSYIGLSGVLNSIWVAGALVCARRSRGTLRNAYLICVLAGLTKIAIEGFGGVAIFTDPAKLGGLPVPIAHALGCLGGWVSIMGASSRGRPPKEQQTPNHALRQSGKGSLDILALAGKMPR